MARTRALTRAERRAWERDGFFVRERAFDERELEALRAAAEAAVERADAMRAGGRDYRVDGNRYVDCPDEQTTIQYEHNEAASTVRVIEPMHHLHPCFEALVDDPRIVEPMRDLVGSEGVALFTDKMNLKRPREGSAFRWHQDSPYWTHACAHVDRLPNVLLAIDDANEANGCFRVVRGSHLRGCLPGIQDGTQIGGLFTNPAFFDESEQVPAEVPAGSLVFFSPHTVHGSQPNRSDRARRALVLTYQPAGHRMFKVPAVRNAG